MIDLTNIDYLGIDHILKRGTGEIVVNYENALLVRDKVSKAYFLACEDVQLGRSVLGQYVHQNCNLLMISNLSLAKIAFEKYGFTDRLECFQVAYYGELPVNDTDILVKVADAQDLPIVTKTYNLISPDEMAEVVEKGNLLLGYDNERLIGFIGEHLEGSMGLLYVFPEFRRKGLATILEKLYIAKTMEKGFVPFGQVEKNNFESLNLQKKIGMTQSEKLICWMWK